MLQRKIKPTKKPDIDNIIKIICNALNGIACKDDAQAVLTHAAKQYGDEPRVDIRMWKIQKGPSLCETVNN